MTERLVSEQLLKSWISLQTVLYFVEESGALVLRALHKSINWSDLSIRQFVSEWLNAFKLFTHGIQQDWDKRLSFY